MEWRVRNSMNPNKSWIIDQNQKPISAIMSTAAAKRLVTAHNQALAYLKNREEVK